jgi:hypothetical protein
MTGHCIRRHLFFQAINAVILRQRPWGSRGFHARLDSIAQHFWR